MKISMAPWLLVTILACATLAVSGLSSQPASATGPWYVAPGGSDANTCTAPGTACASISGALNKPGFVAGDTILVASGVYTGAGDQVVLLNKSAILSGGWDMGFTAQTGHATIDGQGVRRGMTVEFGQTVVVERFTLQNGRVQMQNGSGLPDGGGIRNLGFLTLNNCMVIGNTAVHGAGGGIYNYGPLTVNNTTISGNHASSGAGIYNYYVAVTLNNSTISGNAAREYGGGIANSGYSDTIVTLNNSTVTGNTAWQGGGFNISYSALVLNNSTVSANIATVDGGGIYNYGTVTLQNSILEGNTGESAPDCSGSTIGSAGYNLVGNTSGCNFSASTGDLTNLDARLGQLIGSPGYLPLLSGSPAVNAGNPAGCTGSSGLLVVDQRGAPRVGRCDIGAYEYTVPGPAAQVQARDGTPQTTPPSFIFNTSLQATVLDSIGSPVDMATVHFLAPARGASGTFADSGTYATTAVTGESGVAIAAPFTANATPGSYALTATVDGAVAPADFMLANKAWYVSAGGNDANSCQSPTTPCATINGALHKPGFAASDTILVATGLYTGNGDQVVLIDRNAILSGGWDAIFITQNGVATIDGQDQRRGITVEFGRIATFEHFTVQNGRGQPSGGGIHNDGTLSMNSCRVSSNATGVGGDGRAGAGIFNGGDATLNNCIVSGNTTDSYGGGIYNAMGMLTLINSTVSGNAGNGGGGIYGHGNITLQSAAVRENLGNGIFKAGGTLAVYNSIINENRGSGIYNRGGAVILNDSAVNENDTTGSGGGIFNEGGGGAGTVTLNNSTVSGNKAGEHCGAIVNGGTLVLNNSTVSGNRANGYGGGICAEAGTILRNSILGENIASSSPDCSGAVSSAGYNLISNTTGCSFGAAVGDLTNVDVKIGSFEGMPGYHPLLPDSPAVNGGNPTGCKDDQGNPLPADQRGLPRFGRCDIGAYELQPIGFSTLAVNPSTALPSDLLTYTITLANPGVTDITDAHMINVLPVSIGYIEDSLAATSGTAGYDDGMITWTGSVNAGGTVTVVYAATVNPVLGFIVNSAVISGAGDSVTRSAVTTVDGPICGLAKYTGNPILVAGADGSWDDYAVWGPVVVKEGSSYKMWYSGEDGSNPSQIGLATSTDGVSWTKAAANPVLSPSGIWWETNGVRVGSVISEAGIYKMWYTGIDYTGLARIGYAMSPDGVNWTKSGNNPILYTGDWDTWDGRGVEGPAVFKDGTTYHLWYTGNDGLTRRIGHATSVDGTTWSKDLANPVLDIGSPGAWDWLSVYGPAVVRVGAEYKLWYSGETLPSARQTGYARSSNGSVWTRGDMLIPQASPGAFDSSGADYASVLVDGDTYKVWYSGKSNDGGYTIGHATAGVCSGTSVPATGDEYWAAGFNLPGMDSSVRALAVGPDGSLYAGGDFTTAGGVAANYIARWDGATSSWHPLSSGMSGLVYALALSPDGSLYAAGSFTTAGGVAANRIARWDGSQWHPLGSGLDNWVGDLAFGPDGSIYAGGLFTTAGEVTANRIARWDGVQWHPLGSGIDSGWIVNTLAFGPDGSLYAGGGFTSSGGIAANNIARWDGTQWHPLGSGMTGGSSPGVHALAFGPDGSLYVGGYFTAAGGVAANNIARWDGAQWYPLGSGVGGFVYSLSFGPDNSLYAGGYFTTAGGFAANHIARWDGSQWHLLGSGMGGTSPSTGALAFGPDSSLYAGGHFTTAGGKPSSYIAQWNGEAVRRCDFNDSGAVDVGDILIVAALWNQPAGPPYDLDGDGVITVVDITRTARWWEWAVP